MLADDLTTQGVSEPYRMFTSRAEFRLSLRADNADLRLTAKGIDWGCVGSERSGAFVAYRDTVQNALERARAEGNPAAEWARLGFAARADGRWRSVLDMAAIDTVAWDALAAAVPWLRDLPPRAAAHVHAEARYSGYLQRQDADIRRFRKEESVSLDGLDFGEIGSLSAEVADKLARFRPESLGAAARLQGMTPTALASIAAHVRKRRVEAVG